VTLSLVAKGINSNLVDHCIDTNNGAELLETMKTRGMTTLLEKHAIFSESSVERTFGNSEVKYLADHSRNKPEG
jgi:hypothetical protein